MLSFSLKNGVIIMLKSMYLENFKCYGPKGAQFDLAPLTFLYGDNSAGKSTFLQAISLLSDTLDAKPANPFEIDPARRLTDLTDDAFNALVFKRTDTAAIKIQVETLSNDKLCKIERQISKIGNAVALEEKIEGTNKSDLRSFLPMVEHCVAPRPETALATGSSLAQLTRDSVKETMVKYAGEKVNAMLVKLGYHYEYIDTNLFRDLIFEMPVAAKNVGASVHAIANILNKITALMNGGILMLEEPETHLHPKYIGPFAEIIVDAIRNKEKSSSQIVVECHSDLMILAVQGLIRLNRLSQDMVKIIYMTKGAEGTSVSDIPFDENGNFIQEWPDKDGFYPERLDLISRGW